MKSLRAKLFFSVGSIFLVIAILSYVVPTFFIRKDINAGSAYLNQTFGAYQKKFQQLASSWITNRFLDLAVQLEGVTQSISVSKQGIWELAASVISYDPEIAVVQVKNNQGQVAIISSESGRIYTPLWAKDSEGKLWIQLGNPFRLFLAKSIEEIGESTYLLYDSPRKKVKGLRFTPFSQASFLEEKNVDDPEVVYQTLREEEERLVEMSKMISTLAPYHDEAAGILKVNTSFKKGFCILSEEIFSDTPFIEKTTAKEPQLISRDSGEYVDLVQFASSNRMEWPQIAVGFSVTKICSETAEKIQKPLLLYYKDSLLQGFSLTGERIPLKNISTDSSSINFGVSLSKNFEPHFLEFSVESQSQLPNSIQVANKSEDEKSQAQISRVKWEKTIYLQEPIHIAEATVSVLTPESQANAVIRFLSNLRDALTRKVSVNLFTISLLLLAIALLLLARISKKITRPITLLAEASEEIGKGKYEGLHLPPAEKRHDEVAILTHSFQKMVISLKEREKIRGVLNKVVSKEIATKILASSIELGGEERMLTMLFSDIRGFTPLSETLTPRTLIALLNDYMTRMCRIIDETHGVVDKFVGDEIMALYGAPVELSDHVEKAIKAAILMVEDVKIWNQERGEKEPQIKMGIGIHTGVAFSGNMGAENRLNYTVVGANVNLAARLCSAAKPLQILISEHTYQKIAQPSQFHMNKLEPILLKGIDHPITIYEVIAESLPINSK
jgi:class 3 adenylate cyclase/HAMP domain-containing protein